MNSSRSCTPAECKYTAHFLKHFAEQLHLAPDQRCIGIHGLIEVLLYLVSVFRGDDASHDYLGYGQPRSFASRHIIDQALHALLHLLSYTSSARRESSISPPLTHVSIPQSNAQVREMIAQAHQGNPQAQRTIRNWATEAHAAGENRTEPQQTVLNEWTHDASVAPNPQTWSSPQVWIRHWNRTEPKTWPKGISNAAGEIDELAAKGFVVMRRLQPDPQSFVSLNYKRTVAAFFATAGEYQLIVERDNLPISTVSLFDSRGEASDELNIWWAFYNSLAIDANMPASHLDRLIAMIFAKCGLRPGSEQLAGVERWALLFQQCETWKWGGISHDSISRTLLS